MSASLLDHDVAAPGDRSPGAYALLKQRIEAEGCLARQHGYYTGKISFTIALLSAGVGGLVVLDHLALQLLDAVFLGVVFGQLGLLGHDAAHNQICHSASRNRALALLHLNLLTGISLGWWLDKHNRHHAYPNQIAHDPDIDFPVFAFCEEQARAASGWQRVVVRYQPYLFLPLLLFEAFHLRVETLRRLIDHGAHRVSLERVLTAAHFILFLGFLGIVVGPARAALFVVVHHVVAGFYLGCVFAPNHIGMPILSADSDMDFLRRQVSTTRNVRSHCLVDFWFGGLNYQIEHHLFPTMPRNQLRRARRLVREFCAAQGIAYRESGMLRSYFDVLRDLYVVSAPLRVSRVDS